MTTAPRFRLHQDVAVVLVPLCDRAGCESPVPGEPVKAEDDPMGRVFCSEDCLTDEAERTHGAYS